MKRSKNEKNNRHVFFVTVFICTVTIVVAGLVITFFSKVGFSSVVKTAQVDSSQVVEVEDIFPEIVLLGEETVKLNSIDEYVEPGYSSVDDIDGDLTNNVQTNLIQINEYNYQMEYTVTNSTNHTTTKIRNIRIIIGIVCLTFDDGPSIEITPQVLDILEEKDVNATFFVLAYSGEEKTEIIKRAYELGNVIGFHGYSHNYSEIYTSIDVLMENFYKIENLVVDTIGVSSKIIRFPGGTSNTISKNYCEGIMSEAVIRATEEGYIYVDWNVDSNDAGSDETNAENIYNNVVSGLQPGRTNVVLMHDSSNKQATVDALAGIIDYSIQNGYDIQTITETSNINSSKHNVNN